MEGKNALSLPCFQLESFWKVGSRRISEGIARRDPNSTKAGQRNEGFREEGKVKKLDILPST